MALTHRNLFLGSGVLAAFATCGSLAFLTACSDDPTANLPGPSSHRSSAPPPTSSKDEASPASNETSTDDGTANDTSTTSSGGSTSKGKSSPDSSTAPPPPPKSGPGSVGSPAHQFFNKSVFPKLASCVGCHGSNGGSGAPKFLDADVDKAYSALDAYGFIQPNSRLVQKGDHAGGAASGLSNDAKAIVQEWLAKENQDRGGKTTPSILEKLGPCMSRALFATIRFQDLRTVKRAAEDPNRCTGCTNAMCSSCHGDIATPFYTQVGSALGDNTFEMSKKMPYITKYFGVNGTEPVPSHGIAKKQNAVNSTLLTGSHPNFYLLPQVTLAINNFVNDAIAKYKAGTCGNSSL